MEIGVLALQGAVREHRDMLTGLGVECCEVRTPEQLESLDGLLMPGGESTTLEKLMRRFGLDVALQEAIDRGMAVWGTCAGMILLAQRITNAIPGQTGLGHLPVVVERNAFGRQVESCETIVEVRGLKPAAFPAVFIRAPRVVESLSAEVETLGTWEGSVVAVRYQRLLATSFHPELTHDDRLHRYFLESVVGGQ